MDSPIQQQIRALQRRQAKVDYLRLIIGDLTARNDHSEHEGIKDEVLTKLIPFLETQVQEAEQGQSAAATLSPTRTVDFSTEQLDVLKAFFARLAVHSAPPEGSPTPSKPLVKAPDPVHHDKVRFAMTHQGLANKRVTVETKDGPVYGVVQGLDAPNVIVKLDTGYTVPFDVSLIRVEEKK